MHPVADVNEAAYGEDLEDYTLDEEEGDDYYAEDYGDEESQAHM